MAFDYSGFTPGTRSAPQPKVRLSRASQAHIDALRGTLLPKDAPADAQQPTLVYDVTGKTPKEITRIQGGLNAIGRRKSNTEFSVTTQRIERDQDGDKRTFVEAWAVAKRAPKGPRKR